MIRILLAFLTMMLWVGMAGALEPERREVIVVNGRVWEGFQYKENLVPSTIRDFRLMAGKDSAVSFVRTQEYYWPLSRQVYVDFEKQREELKGVLRIEQDGKVIAETELSSYSIVYPDGAINGNGSLVWAGAADEAYEEYRQAEADFARRFVEAQRANTEYEQKLLKSGAARSRGEKVEPIAPPPALPVASLRLVTQPVPGYRIDIPAGSYQIALYADGKLVAGTQRSLQVIDVKGRQSIVADIVPEERWTRPLASNSQAARIFARPGSVFYVTLTDAEQFDEAEYLPVITPQSQPVAGRTMWVRRKPSEKTSINVVWTEPGAPQVANLDRLKVEQTDGSGFGYRVRLAEGAEKEDLKAFMVSVPADANVDAGQISLAVDAEMPFQRDVVVVHPRSGVIGFGLAWLPIFGWGLLAIARRRK